MKPRCCGTCKAYFEITDNPHDLTMPISYRIIPRCGFSQLTFGRYEEACERYIREINNGVNEKVGLN